ncbi:TonB-dependent receptor [Thalassotalea fusca]
MFRFNRVLLAMGIGVAVISGPIRANGLELNDNKSTAAIEVIEVYAQKRAQKITDVAVAVTVLDGETVDRIQLKDTTQLSIMTPNMKITNNAGEGTPPAFNIRGVGMIDYNTSTVSPIAVYSDGVVSGSANNLSVNLFDIEQVEVLRGPQGTLFGRNTTGGAVLVMSKLPEPEFGGYANFSIAEHDHTSFDGALNLPLTDNTAVRFSVNREDYHFSNNNLLEGHPDGGLQQTNLRLIVKSDWEDVTLIAKLHAEDWQGKPKPIASRGIIKADGSGTCTLSQAGSDNCLDAFGGTVGGDEFWDVRADTADREHDTESWGTSLKLVWQFADNMALTSISGYRELDRFHSWDSDGAMNLVEGTMGTDNSLFSQELSISVTGDNSYWQSGLFYLKETIDQDNSFDLFRDFRGILDAGPGEFFYDNSLENSSIAVFSQLDYDLSMKTVVTAGLRYTDETTDYHSFADLDTHQTLIPGLWDLTGKVAEDEWSGKLAIRHQVSPNTNVYASYTRGYKSGGYNAGYAVSPLQAADSEYQSEQLNAYEIGSKMQLVEQSVSLNIAAFYYDYKDQQIFVNYKDSAIPFHVLKNGGDSTIYGAELELMVVPSQDWQFVFNVGYLPEAKTGQFEDVDYAVNENRLPFSSKWNVGGYALYETFFGSNALTAQLGFDYQSSFFFDQNENPYTEQEGYVTFYGRLSYQWQDDILVSLWGKNLTNTEYAELRFDSVGVLGAVTELKGEQRQLGVEVKYSF